MVIISYQTLRLQMMYHGINLFQVPVYRRFVGFVLIIWKLVPVPVEPDSCDWTILSKQFCQLGFHECNIMVPVAFGSSSGPMPCTSGFVLIIAAIPVQQRIVYK